MLSRACFALALAVTSVCPFLDAKPALAQDQSIGIRLLDAPESRADDPRARLYIVDHLAPGTTIERRVEVSNDTDGPQAIQLYAASATVTGGNFEFGDGRSANELTSWVKVDPPRHDLAPRTRGVSTVTIVVPSNASEGEKYGVVWAEVASASPTGGGISAVNRVGVRIYLSVGPGGEPASDFTITTLDAQRTKEGDPVVAANVRNTGGRALDLNGDLKLSNGPGGLSAGPFNAKLGTTLGVGETEPVLVTLDRAIPLGPWEARIVLRSGTTEREAKATLTFPAESGSAAEPVEAQSDDSGGANLLLVAGVPALAICGVFFVVFLRKRGDRETGTRSSP